MFSNILSAAVIAILLGGAMVAVSIIEFQNIATASEYQQKLFNQRQYSDNLDSILNTTEIHSQQPWVLLLGNAIYYQEEEFQFYDKELKSTITLNVLSQFSNVLNDDFGEQNWWATLYAVSPEGQRVKVFGVGKQDTEKKRYAFTKTIPLPNNSQGQIVIWVYTQQSNREIGVA